MTVSNINPTAMELKNLKKKLNTATRGHKLLKDKRDELMRQFLEKIKENKELRSQVEREIAQAQFHMEIALSLMTKEEVETALMIPKHRIELEIAYGSIMSVKVPILTLEYSNEKDIVPYGYAFVSGELDDAVKKFSGVFHKMIKLAEIEKSCQLMAREIEKTRRRVNALEYVIIPRYSKMIGYIADKLEENERSNIARLMKVKEMIIL